MAERKLTHKRCPVCDNEFTVDYTSTRSTCSAECAAILRKNKIKSSVKICKICGSEFSSDSNTAIYCTRDHYRPCPICGEPVRFLNPDEPPRTCSEWMASCL